jgi:DNA-binding transcriptional ArsR family regulator
MPMTSVTPRAVQSVDCPQQLKAFTDPLRIRILVALAERAATNQQLADMLGAPQANVLYHLRFLLKVDLILLVGTQVKGGNVEKYYRAVARTFDLQLAPDLRPRVTGAEFVALGQEVAASAGAWPEQPPRFVARGRRVSPAQAAAFFARLQAFLAEFWSDPHAQAPDALSEADTEDAAPDAALFYCAAVVYRDAWETAPAPAPTPAADDHDGP